MRCKTLKSDENWTLLYTYGHSHFIAVNVNELLKVAWCVTSIMDSWWSVKGLICCSNEKKIGLVGRLIFATVDFFQQKALVLLYIYHNFSSESYPGILLFGFNLLRCLPFLFVRLFSHFTSCMRRLLTKT